jgi:hypothetical protein
MNLKFKPFLKPLERSAHAISATKFFYTDLSTSAHFVAMIANSVFLAGQTWIHVDIEKILLK